MLVASVLSILTLAAAFSGCGGKKLDYGDATFGSDGVVTTDFGSDAEATFVALQPDGKLIVAGAIDRNRCAGCPLSHLTPTDVALARYAHTGKLDPGFGK